MSSRVRTALFALLVLLVTVGPAVTPAAGSPAEPVPATDSIEADQPNETTFHVTLLPDGDARWAVRMNYSLETDARRAAFEEFAASYTSRGDSRTVTAIEEASREASEATGREMAITDVEYDSVRHNDTGQLVVRFRWTNFSRVTGSRLRVDDVFNTTSGTWFRSLADDQRLVIVPPRGYDSLVGASPAGYEVSNTSLRWEGERTFQPGDLSVTYKRVTTPTRPTEDGNLALFLVPGLVAGVVVLGYFLWASDSSVALPGGVSRSEDDGDEPPGSTAPAEAAESPVSADPPADEGTAEATGPPVDEELLSDEERIERLLERNGGRMKQANIVKETGWSNAKVSQLLSSMDEADRIDKLRIGRENLISFPDEDVTDTDDSS